MNTPIGLLILLTAAIVPRLVWAADPPSGTEPAATADWSVAHALARMPRCAVDEIVHRIQGQPQGGADGGEAACPASPSALDPSYGIASSALFYFDIAAGHMADLGRSGYPGYRLEGLMRDVGPPGSPGLQCVYVGCMKLSVAAQGVATRGLESCLGPLTGGTSQPAPQAPACPAAVQIGGAFRPFTRTRPADDAGEQTAPVCCYTIPAPIPPGQ
jgi:hypothetical protein